MLCARSPRLDCPLGSSPRCLLLGDLGLAGGAGLGRLARRALRRPHPAIRRFARHRLHADLALLPSRARVMLVLAGSAS